MVGRMVRLGIFSLLILVASVGAVAAKSSNFRTHLSGDEENPARATLAQGQALFQLSEDGTSIHYRLIVANIENVVVSHIHLGAAGVNGPVVVFLYGPVAPGGGRRDGVLAEGTF